VTESPLNPGNSSAGDRFLQLTPLHRKELTKLLLSKCRSDADDAIEKLFQICDHRDDHHLTQRLQNFSIAGVLDWLFHNVHQRFELGQLM